MSEKKLERDCCRLAQSQGWIAMKLVSPNRVGIPDRMFLGFKGQIEFVEFKSPTGHLSPSQDRSIRQFRRHGQNVFVIDDVDVFARDVLGMSK